MTRRRPAGRLTTRAARGAAVLAALLALSGCVRLTTETTFGTDDTVTQHTVVAMTAQARTTLQERLGSVADRLPDGVDGLLDPATVRRELAPLARAHPGAVDVTPYTDDQGRAGVEITVSDVPLDALDDAAGGASALTGASSVTRERDAYVVVVRTGAASALAAAGVDAGQLSLAGGAVEVRAAFTFPGLVRSASAGEIAGHTVTLGLADLAGSDEIRIVGGATVERDWAPLLRWGLVALGALVIVGGAILLVVQDRRRRHRSPLPPPRAAGDGVGTLGGGPPDPPG
ncbi:LppM family (lipo)protein [Demequina soli]|uniref:LppM family (lipo)protein n=1 Tax=Demequina soli TaxID=1638987 RepID=UPI000782F291|nr:hypothetical protein [Demequina soli]